MALANWTKEQILDQLLSGASWSGNLITYALPTVSSGMYGYSELTGFKSLNATQQAMAQLSLQTWDDVMGADLQKTTATTSQIEFGYSSTGVSFAHSYMPSVGSVWFSTAYADLATPQIGQHGFLTYIHEEGHALGLDHMGNYNGNGNWTPSSYQDSSVYSIMSYFGPNWGNGMSAGEGLVAWADWVGADGKLYAPQTPMINDIMAIQSLYGIETTTRVGDTIYGFHCNVTGTTAQLYDFSVNKNPIMALFDSSGIDTLDLSGWSTNSTVNLMPGSFSSCNSMTNNISIAYTCNIENAIGGAGADQITGNDLNNLLDGGSGADVLLGGLGDDFLIGGAGNDTIDGGAGNDKAIFSGTFASYTYTYNATLQSWTFNNTSTGTDQVKGVEYFSFADVVKTASQLTGGTPVPVTPAFSISTPSNSLAEGNSGNTTFNFTISLDKASVSAQSVKWTVAGTGTAAASANDFASLLTGTATIAAGQTSATVQVLVAGDTVVENDETFAVSLSGPSTGTTLGTSSASATIRNDDVAVVLPKFSIATSNASVVEGNSGSTAVNFTVSLDKASTSAQSVKWTVAGIGTAAASANDFKSALSGTATIAAGQTSASVQVLVAGDTVVESDETFAVTLSGTSNGSTLGSSSATLTIRNDDAAIPADDYLSTTATTGLVQVNGSATAGKIEKVNDCDLFKVTLAAGTSYSFDLVGTGGGLNTYLELYGPGMVGLAMNDNANGSTNSQIIYTATASGTYYLAAWDTATGTGSYSLGAKILTSLNLTGDANANLLMGARYDDVLKGLAGDDWLVGDAGNDMLDGGTGADYMDGGFGNDTYLVDNAFDWVVEANASGGTDLVQSSVSFSLAANVENLTLTGATSINGYGNSLANVLQGNAAANLLVGGSGNDTLIGGNGNDTLYGGAGSDLFVLNITPNTSGNLDTIGDFQSNADKIQLSRVIFTALGSSATSLTQNQFWSGAGVTKGHDADDRVVYNSSTGALYYDADGSGSAAAVQIALMGTTTHPTLQYLDILVIA